MAWDTGWPPVSTSGGTDWQSFAMARQLWEALRDRGFCVGGKRWPRCNAVHAEGVVNTLTDNLDGTATLTISSPEAVPEGRTDDGTCFNGNCRPLTCSGKYFAFLSCEDAPYYASRYDVIFESDNALRNDPWCVCRGLITDNANGSITFELQQIENHIKAGWLASLATLVGKRFYVVNKDGMWWGDRVNRLGRWLDYPNGQEAWRGSVASGSMETISIGYVFQDTDDYTGKPVGWAIDQWTDFELLVYSDDGYLQRYPIFGNDEQILWIGNRTNVGGSFKTFSGSSKFTIVVAGAKGDPQRENGYHRWHYGGTQLPVFSHMPDDPNPLTVAARSFAAPSVSFPEDGAPGLGCLDAEHAAFERDVWSSLTNYCPPADFNYSPFLYKTLNGIQVGVEDFVPAFVERKSYDNTGWIPNYTLARAFHHCGINSGTATTTSTPDGAGQYSFTISDPAYEGETVYFTIVASGLYDSYLIRDDDNVVDGSGTVVDGVVNVGAEVWYASQPVIWSAGWTRRYPLEVSHFYDSYVFIPDIQPTGLGGFAAVDPPAPYDFCCEDVEFPPAECCNQCDGVGSWHSRLKSLKTKAFTTTGFATEDRVFREGDMVRYVGDGWSDPGTGNQVFVNLPGNETANLLKQYWDRFYEGRHPDAMQFVLNSQLGGDSTSATTDSVTDNGKDWWSFWTGGGTLVTITGAAASGGETSLTLASSFANPESEDSCWFRIERFPYASFIYEGFIIEIDKTVGMVTTAYKRPITNCVVSGGTVTITFAGLTGFSVTAGDVWRIREPRYNLNRLKGRRVKLVDPDGTLYTRHITHSDDDTVWLDTAIPAVASPGWKYQIIEYLPGGVWMYTEEDPAGMSDVYQKIETGKWWVKPTGTDPRGSEPWHENQTENLPHKSDIHFGKMHKGDYVYQTVFDELYAMINSLVWTKTTGEIVDDAPNVNRVFQSNDGVSSETWDDVKASAVTDFDSGAFEIQNGAIPPSKFKRVEGYDGRDDPFAAPEDYNLHDVTIRSSQQTYTVVAPNLIAHKAGMYVYVGLDEFDSDVDTVENDTRVFDAQGDNVYFRRWGNVLNSPASTTAVEGVTIGDMTVEPPNWPSVPLNPIENAQVKYRGWAMVGPPIVILKWNVTGGLKYVDTTD